MYMSRTLSGATHEKPRQANVREGCLKDKHRTATSPSHHSGDAIKLKSAPDFFSTQPTKSPAACQTTICPNAPQV